MATVLAEASSDSMEAILQFIDDGAKTSAFEHSWRKLEGAASSYMNLDALRICVRLLPPFSSDKSVILLYERLQSFVVDHVPKEPDDAEHQYLLADICLSNAQLASMIFNELTNYMTTTAKQLHSNDELEASEYGGLQLPKQELLCKFRAYLRILRRSYWLPPDRYHYVTPDLLNLLISCIGNNALDEDAHDSLSALLSLLTNSPVVVLDDGTLPRDWLDVHLGSDKPILNNRIISDALFVRFEQLPSKYFLSNATRAFRTWFQWISCAVADEIDIKALYSSFYWSTLRNGLVSGFADQRKYCLGILRTSLLIPHHPIDLPQMTLGTDKRLDFIAQYDKYATLFEIIVLDRYANQVQACLPDLTALLGPSSLISPDWSTALLSAALNSKVQDGIRKLVGNWYLNYVIRQQGSIFAHANFLVEGLLPWATQGSLLTGSLISTRAGTSCSHGAALASTIARFIAAMHTDTDRRQVLARVLTFILDTGGRIFSPSVLYLLEGLLQGLETRPLALGAAELKLILQVSRLPAFPEIGTDLCSTYFAELSGYIDTRLLLPEDFSGYGALKARFEVLKHDGPASSKGTSEQLPSQQTHNELTSLEEFNKRLEKSQHKIVQDGAFKSACGELTRILNRIERDSVLPDELFKTLDSLWEEADRQEFPRGVIVSIAPLLFHPACVNACYQDYIHDEGSYNRHGLVTLLSKALMYLQNLAQGKPYVLSILATCVRRACFSNPRIIGILPFASTMLQLINNPLVPQKEFLFEIVAAQKLQQYLPERDYAAYYGQREWHGYAALIDTVNRIPDVQLFVAQRLMDQLLEPWQIQKAPIPVVSKWKNVLQLQTMLLLTESCVNDGNSETYLDAFAHALVLEHWPLFRYLLEWIIARIYYRFPSKTDRILIDLARLDENSPAHIASLIKLGILCAPFLTSEKFTLNLMIELIALSASPKVQIRHEAHWSFPTLFEFAVKRNWTNITGNPAFQALNSHIRKLDKYIAPPSTLRTLKLDVVGDYTITNIFQGRYLSIETPELAGVAHEDFIKLYLKDSTLLDGLETPPARVPLGGPIPENSLPVPALDGQTQLAVTTETADTSPGLFQKKSGFNIASLLPTSGPPSVQQKRPASVILIASLIDNPTNIGGLSRISESFGLEALYIDDLRKIAHKDFKATSVTSEKHFPILELKVVAVPDFITSLKRQGYEVVGIEQTDRSGMLGEEDQGGKGVGKLPKKCVLVLGSERGGISSDVLAVVDRCVEIRTVGVTRSLNVQTAGGIAIYEWWREWGGAL